MYLTKGIVAWLLISSLIVIFDASYVLLRPESMRGGSLFQYFSPYELYCKFDTLYCHDSDRFVVIQSWLNLMEITMAFISLAMYAFGKQSTQLLGSILAVIVSAFTFWKTVIYIWYADAYLTHDAHTFTTESIYVFYFPTAFWIVFPLYVLWVVPRRIVKHTLPVPKVKLP